MTQEQRTELDELRRNNPQAYSERIREIMEEMRVKREEEAAVRRNLIEAYRNSRSEVDRQALRERLEQDYDQRMKMLEDQVKRMQKSLDNQLANKENYLDNQIKQLVK